MPNDAFNPYDHPQANAYVAGDNTKADEAKALEFYPKMEAQKSSLYETFPAPQHIHFPQLDAMIRDIIRQELKGFAMYMVDVMKAHGMLTVITLEKDFEVDEGEERQI